jgi:hypothetical protein
MDFPRFGTAPYHKLVTDGRLAVLVDCPADLEQEVRQAVNAHEASYIGEPEQVAL